MLLDEVWSLCESTVFTTPSSAILFNPYRDRTDALDRPDADAVRRDNLRRYLACYTTRPPVLLVAEAPGPWGCRFSGVPLVSEAQLVDTAFPISGQPTSLQEEPHTEYSASIYWRTLRPYFPHFFTWNTVPYHPHKPGQPLTIRTPRAAEINASLHVLRGILRILRPELVLAIGRKAEHALKKLDAQCLYIRHPSQGGAKLFAAGVQEVMQALALPDTPTP